MLLLFLLPATPVRGSAPLLQPDPFTFESTACMFELPLMSFMSPESWGFKCGYVTVPEQHANPTGPTIRLPVAILKAKGENPEPDPLFLAQGGPGGDAFGVFSLLMSNSVINQTRDLVIFNQRGTLYAEPQLTCTEVFETTKETLTLPANEFTDRAQAAYQACYSRLQAEGIDLSAYNSLENAADVDAIRRALGYDQINFYGVSYGTLLGLHLIQNFPDHLRSVILDAVVPPQLNFIPLIPQGTNRVFTELFAACQANPQCRADYPDLEQRFFALVDRLNEQPVMIELTDAETGDSLPARLDGDNLLAVIFQVLYLPNAYTIFPKVVVDLEAGDYRFIEDIWSLVQFDRTISDGMYFSVICAEDADFDPEAIPLAGVRPQIARNAARDLRESYLETCAIWQVALLPPTIDAPVQSDIPTLLLSGQFDPITPPANAAAAAETLPASYNYVSPVGSHGALGTDPCIERIMLQFLNNPTVEPNAACLSDIAAADFVPPNALRVDLVSRINALESSVFVEMGLAGLFLGMVLSAYLVWPLALLINWLRRQPPRQPTPAQKRLGWLGRSLALLFGLLAVALVSGLTLFVIDALSGSLAMVSAVSPWAAPLFVIPPLLALLALGMLIVAGLFWRRSVWSIWGRLYYTLLAGSALAYVVILAAGGLMTVLW